MAMLGAAGTATSVVAARDVAVLEIRCGVLWCRVVELGEKPTNTADAVMTDATDA
ncbi:MAG: hypothetical protein ACR2MQ_01485 [Gemmatimonadaceae bacterium]